MDGQILFNILIGVASAAGGWVLKMIWDVISELRKDVKELNREVNQDFVRRQDFREAVGELKADMREGFKEVKDAIGLLFDRVNEKADR